MSSKSGLICLCRELLFKLCAACQVFLITLKTHGFPRLLHLSLVFIKPPQSLLSPIPLPKPLTLSFPSLPFHGTCVLLSPIVEIFLGLDDTRFPCNIFTHPLFWLSLPSHFPTPFPLLCLNLRPSTIPPPLSFYLYLSSPVPLKSPSPGVCF